MSDCECITAKPGSVVARETNPLEEALCLLFDFADRAFEKEVRDNRILYVAAKAPTLSQIVDRINNLKRAYGDPRPTPPGEGEEVQAGAEEKAD